MVALTLVLYRFVGHWALAVPVGMGAAGTTFHFIWCRRNGIDPIRQHPLGSPTNCEGGAGHTRRTRPLAAPLPHPSKASLTKRRQAELGPDASSSRPLFAADAGKWYRSRSGPARSPHQFESLCLSLGLATALLGQCGRVSNRRSASNRAVARGHERSCE